MSNISIPTPFSFTPSQRFEGSDGSWSSFIIRVGTPEQNFRILPSTNGQETWVPVQGSCRPGIDPDFCGDRRGLYPDSEGVYGFNANVSSSWKLMGIYPLGLEERLNISGNGEYGLDNVGLSVQNSNGVTLHSQIVGGFATRKFMLGEFGLGPKPTNFSGYDYPQPSFLKTMWDQKMIPSLSWGYTAGASYKIPQYAGSLTLGGYDTSRYTPASNNTSFPFDQNDSRSLSVGIQRITVSNAVSGNTVTALRSPIVTLIDSAVPHIWLPREVCDVFETTFGLTYDNQTDLYLVNDTMHEKLQATNPTITFALGNSLDPSQMTNIVLPYAAVDLQASWPIYNATRNYFPLRRATNETQYTLGRTFLQEAYIVADYERQNFSIYQASFGDKIPQQKIVSIISPTLQNITANSTSHTGKPQLSTPAVVGISIGSVIGATALFLLIFFLLRRRRPRPPKQDAFDIVQISKDEKDPGAHELFQEFGEVIGSKVQYEIDSKNFFQLEDSGSIKVMVHEMPTGDWQSMRESVRRESELPIQGARESVDIASDEQRHPSWI